MTDLLKTCPPITLNTLTDDGCVVILAPHADDESLACGGLLAALFASVQAGMNTARPAHVICMTDGSGSHPNSRTHSVGQLAQVRKTELLGAVVALGGEMEDVTFLNYPDGWLGATDCSKIACTIVDICDRLQAKALFSASSVDNHEDHKSTARIAQSAVEMRPHLRLWSFPVWSRWDDPNYVAAHAPSRPHVFATGPWQASKRRAIEAHASQLGRVVFDDSCGFEMQKDFVEFFITEPELFFEVLPCP